MAHVYLSYFFKDKAFTDRLVADLRAAGVNIWRDVDQIAPGQDFSDASKDAIADADAFAVVAGSASALTEYMAVDLVNAMQRQIPILQLRLVEHPKLRIEQKQLHHIELDFMDYDAGLRALLAALPASVKLTKPITPEAPKSKGYVFISFAEEDSDFVTKLRDFLKEQGYGYWDYQTSDRNYHTQLFLELEEVIKGAAATISVLSPDWKRSAWAAKEYLFSEEVSTPVFLLMAREMGPTLVTAGIAYIDFTRDEAAGFAKLDRELRRRGL